MCDTDISTPLHDASNSQVLKNEKWQLLNERRLHLKPCKYTLLSVVVSDLFARITHNLLVVDLCFSRDLAENHYHTGLGARLASDFACF